MDTPRARSPRPLPPLSSSKPTPPLPPPPPPPFSSATASPSAAHDFPFTFSYSASSSPAFGGHLHPGLSSMSRATVGRVGSDLSHISYSKATRHPTTSCGATGGSKDDRDRAKSNRTPPFFSGLGGAWRNSKESSSSGDTTKKKDKAKSRAVDVGQWVKKYMAAMVEQLRSSFYGLAERDRHRHPRPHSFSARDPNAAAREPRRRGQPLSSAPASLRVSPANSGHLSVGGSVKVSTSSEESTMEELQNAVEAAIAHCKSSMSRAQAQRADGDSRRGDRTN